MATIEEEMKAQKERENQERRIKIELDARMETYQNIATIKRWVVFWSILAVISLIIFIIATIGSLAMVA